MVLCSPRRISHHQRRVFLRSIYKDLFPPNSHYMSNIYVEYQFKLSENNVHNFKLEIDSTTVECLPKIAEPYPEWTKLEFHQCSHCPYSSSTIKTCSVALRIAGVAEAFKNEKSFTKATVFVRTGDRIYGKVTDIQTGLQSLFGLVMATSGCSHLDFFKPMALHHLPFATYEETMVRVLGQYLIQQYINKKSTGSGDFDLKDFKTAYEKINKVNQGIIERIRTISSGDADKNAIIILDNFASMLPLEIDTGFESLSPIFKQQKSKSA